MHRLLQSQVMRTRGLRDNVEDILAGKASAAPECREEIADMQEQAAWIRGLRAPADCEPKPGFYARVMERIDAQRAISIWILFFESQLGRRLALASMTLAVCLGMYLVSSEQSTPPPVARPAAILTGSPDRDAVLMNLVTYREQ
jgi:hypothetical protein